MKTEAELDLTIIILLIEMVTAGKHSDGVEKEGPGFPFKRISDLLLLPSLFELINGGII